MSDPRHPTKVLIVVEGGCVVGVYQDKPTDIRFFVADYDNTDYDDFVEQDARGRKRSLHEESAWQDTVEMRAIMNKRGKPNAN